MRSPRGVHAKFSFLLNHILHEYQRWIGPSRVRVHALCSHQKKNNAKFSVHYVLQRTHNIRVHALRSDQLTAGLVAMINNLVAKHVHISRKTNQ